MRGTYAPCPRFNSLVCELRSLNLGAASIDRELSPGGIGGLKC